MVLATATNCAHGPDHFAQAELYLRAGNTQQARMALAQATNDACVGPTLPNAGCGDAYLRAGDIASRAGDAPTAIAFLLSGMNHGRAQAKERLAIENTKILAQQGPMESTIVVHKVNDIGPQLKLTKDLVWLDGKPITSEVIASGPHWLAVWFEFHSTSTVVGRYTYRVSSTQFFRTPAGLTTVTVRTYLDGAKSGPAQLTVKFQIVPPPPPEGKPRDATSTAQ